MHCESVLVCRQSHERGSGRYSNEGENNLYGFKENPSSLNDYIKSEFLLFPSKGRTFCVSQKVLFRINAWNEPAVNDVIKE